MKNTLLNYALKYQSIKWVSNMKLCIAGSRKIKDKKVLLAALKKFDLGIHNVTEVLCGMAEGADTLGLEWAKENGIKVSEYPADWKNLKAKGAVIREGKFGKYNARAGFDRNRDMSVDGDGVLALQSDGDTNGTQDCVDCFEKAGKKTFIYTGENDGPTVDKSVLSGGQYIYEF